MLNLDWKEKHEAGYAQRLQKSKKEVHGDQEDYKLCPCSLIESEKKPAADKRVSLRGLHEGPQPGGYSVWSGAVTHTHKARAVTECDKMGVCRQGKLVKRNEQIPEQVLKFGTQVTKLPTTATVRTSPDLSLAFFSNGTGSSARHQNCPDAVFVRSIPGRSAYLDPSKIPPHYRNIHLVEFSPDTHPFPPLEAATAQHPSTFLTRLKTRSSINPNIKAVSTLATPLNLLSTQDNQATRRVITSIQIEFPCQPRMNNCYKH
eukprot:666158-Pelagomonas_calceolata.AAC.1